MQHVVDLLTIGFVKVEAQFVEKYEVLHLLIFHVLNFNYFLFYHLIYVVNQYLDVAVLTELLAYPLLDIGVVIQRQGGDES